MRGIKDTTPAALTFFSTLYDPKIIPSLQQLLLQLTYLKGKKLKKFELTLIYRFFLCCTYFANDMIFLYPTIYHTF